MTSVGVRVGDTCPICLDELSYGPGLASCTCAGRHVFHRACVKPWVRRHHTCPLCRQHCPKPVTFKFPKPAKKKNRKRTHPVPVPPPAEQDTSQMSLMEQLCRAQRRLEQSMGNAADNDIAAIIERGELLRCTSAQQHGPLETRDYPRRRQRCTVCRTLVNQLFCCATCRHRYCETCRDQIQHAEEPAAAEEQSTESSSDALNSDLQEFMEGGLVANAHPISPPLLPSNDSVDLDDEVDLSQLLEDLVQNPALDDFLVE